MTTNEIQFSLTTVKIRRTSEEIVFECFDDDGKHAEFAIGYDEFKAVADAVSNECDIQTERVRCFEIAQEFAGRFLSREDIEDMRRRMWGEK